MYALKPRNAKKRIPVNSSLPSFWNCVRCDSGEGKDPATVAVPARGRLAGIPLHRMEKMP